MSVSSEQRDSILSTWERILLDKAKFRPGELWKSGVVTYEISPFVPAWGDDNVVALASRDFPDDDDSDDLLLMSKSYMDIDSKQWRHLTFEDLCGRCREYAKMDGDYLCTGCRL